MTSAMGEQDDPGPLRSDIPDEQPDGDEEEER